MGLKNIWRGMVWDGMEGFMSELDRGVRAAGRNEK